MSNKTYCTCGEDSTRCDDGASSGAQCSGCGACLADWGRSAGFPYTVAVALLPAASLTVTVAGKQLGWRISPNWIGALVNEPVRSVAYVRLTLQG